MGDLNECANEQCGKIYDVSAIGAGTSFCSRRCKYEHKNGPLATTKPVGRPGLHPKPNDAMRMVILNQLRSRGWHIAPLDPKKYPYRFIISRGWIELKLTIGGSYREARWADMFAFIPPNATSVEYKSACRRLPTIKHIPMKDAVATKKMRVYGPCGQSACKKCSNIAWFRALMQEMKSQPPIELDNQPTAG